VVALDLPEPVPTGDLLAGLAFPYNPACDAWLAVARQRWRTRRREGLVAAAESQQAAGNLDQAIVLAERLLVDEPLLEHAHRRLIGLYLRRGDRAAALAAFERCERALQRELGTRPSQQTLDLIANAGPSGSVGHAGEAPGAGQARQAFDTAPEAVAFPVVALDVSPPPAAVEGHADATGMDDDHRARRPGAATGMDGDRHDDRPPGSAGPAMRTGAPPPAAFDGEYEQVLATLAEQGAAVAEGLAKRMLAMAQGDAQRLPVLTALATVLLHRGEAFEASHRAAEALALARALGRLDRQIEANSLLARAASLRSAGNSAT
jgi:tetratricopeptide (TPR) repeat protein